MLAIQEKRSKLFFAILSLPATSMGFALSVQISALSWILTTRYGLEIHDIGLVWAAGPLAGIFGQVIIGILSDRVWLWNGRRRPFIIIGGTIAALMLLALPNIDVVSSALGFTGVLGVALAIVLSLDLAINISFNPTRAIIADVTPPGIDRTKGYTWMQTMSGTFSVGAYAIGAYFGNYVLIYVGAVLVLLFSLVPPLFIEESRTIANDEQAENINSGGISVREILQNIQPLWGFLVYDIYAMTMRLAGIEQQNYYAEVLCGGLTIVLIVKALMANYTGKSRITTQRAAFRKILAAHSFSWIGIHTTFVFLVIYVQNNMAAVSDIGVGQIASMSFLILNAVGAVLPIFVLEPLTERFGRVKTHAGSLAVMTAGYVAMYLYGSTPVFIYSFMAVIGIGWASMISLPFAIMSQSADKARMGLFMGLFNLSIVLPQLVVSLGISLAVSRTDNIRIIFLISAIALALSTVSWMQIRDDQDEKHD